MSTLGLLIEIVIFVLIVQAVLSWIPTHPDSPFYPVQSFLNRVVSPIYAPIRRVIPPMRFGGGVGVDITPMIVIIVLGILARSL